MISNAAGFKGSISEDFDGLWRIWLHAGSGYGSGPFPLYPDGFRTQAELIRWWLATSRPIECKVCHHVFFSSRSDAEFCTPKCRAKYNRRQQGASEHVYTGAYHQRDESDRTHERQADTFEYQCEYCGKRNTARAEAKRSGRRSPKFCNDNGGKCRQAAYRAAKKRESRRDQTSYTPPTSNKSKDTPPTHDGRWYGTRSAIDFIRDVYIWNHKGQPPEWSPSTERSDALAWAKRYIATNHPDKTGVPADTLYKHLSDAYSHLRKHKV